MLDADFIFVPALDPDALAWARTAGASAGQRQRVSTLIRALKKAGVWTSLDRLWLFAAENSTQALTDLVARAGATLPVAPTFTANRGYQGNGSSQYIDTGFNATSGSPRYARNDAHMSVWVQAADSVGSAAALIGNDFTNYGLLTYNSATEIVSGGINSSAPFNIGGGAAMTGHVLMQRTGANAQATYKNGSQLATDASASVAVANNTFFVLAVNSPGAANFSNSRIAAASVGASLSAGQITALNAALNAYMTSVGAA